MLLNLPPNAQKVKYNITTHLIAMHNQRRLHMLQDRINLTINVVESWWKR